MRDNALNEDERLSVAEAAGALGISVRTVRNLIDQGELPAYRITPRRTFILREDLDTFVENRRTAAGNARKG